MELFQTKSICSVLACLMKQPSLIDEGKIKLNREDFYAKGETKFYQIVFAAINNLYLDGLTEEISPANIDEYISHYDTMYEIFNKSDGIEFLYAIEESLSNIHAYHRYSTRVKKFTLLRQIVDYGFSLEGIYEESEDEEENARLQSEFEQLTIDDIIEHYEKIINNFASEFRIGHETESGIAGEHGLDLFESFRETPQYGVATCGEMQNTIFRGQLLGASLLRSAATNTFKSRTALAEATDLAITRWYDWDKHEWIDKGNPENVLYISTEMEQEELEPTIWSYISGVKEENIKDYNLEDDEVEIIKESISDLAQYKNFFIEYIPKFDPDTIYAIIKKYVLQHNVQYVFFDYIHLNTQTMIDMASKTIGMKNREDLMLGTFAASLAEMAKEFGVHLSTSTQVNGEINYAKKLDQTVLRGAKNMADKFTKAVIMTRPSQEDNKLIEAFMAKSVGILKKPNMIWHIYKNRHSKFKGKLYMHVDFDTMRMEDLFMTDEHDNIIQVPKRQLIADSAEKVEHVQDYTIESPF